MNPPVVICSGGAPVWWEALRYFGISLLESEYLKNNEPVRGDYLRVAKVSAKSFRKSFLKCGLWLGANLCGAAREKVPYQACSKLHIDFCLHMDQKKKWRLAEIASKIDHLIWVI